MARRPTRSIRPPHPGEQGFLIIGVVIFVLALTIIGLSLFSLSSFEAQFLGTSTRGTQAFYAATGGIERAMNVLDDTDSLQAVTLDLPLENVIYARARYWNDLDAEWESTGVVPWGGDPPVEIRVVAEIGGVRRVVEARYRAEKSSNIYNNLFTTRTKLIVETTSVAPPPPYNDAHMRTFIAGRVVQGIDDPSGVALARSAIPLFPSEYEYDPALPTPDAGPFIASHSGASEPVFSTPSDYTFGVLLGHAFFAGGTSVASGSTETGFSFRCDVNEVRLLVGQGRAIWLLDGGGYFGGHVQVIGTPGLSTLVVVATPGTNPRIPTSFPPLPEAGLWFEGGISSNIPVIFVSSGTVAIEHYVVDKNTDLPFVSIFAGGVLLKGPHPGYHLSLVHPPTLLQGPPLGTDLEILQPLLENNLLPNSPVGGGRATFTLEPGTWREVTESNPS
jgi:hypothetical protein